MASKVMYRKRAWLNSAKSHDNGWIKAEVWRNDYNGEVDVDASFMIADCSRTITLSLDVYNKTDKKARLKKIDILIRMLLETRAAIESVEYHEVK